MDEIAVIREGEGPEVLLVHGGASPMTTWSGLESLKSRSTLATAYRRGFPPSPPPPGARQDFDVDAADIEPMLDRRPHVVAQNRSRRSTTSAESSRWTPMPTSSRSPCSYRPETASRATTTRKSRSLAS